MLNPEFQLLDPDAEQIERLAQMADIPEEEQSSWEEMFLSIPTEDQAAYLRRLTEGLARPGVHTARELCAVMQSLTESTGVAPLETFTYGWPDSLLAAVLGQFEKASVLLLGVLDGDGIWAGCLAGVSRGGLDFLTTFDTLWADEPELAAKQAPQDLPDLCRAAKSRFTRPAGGLFIYRDEFLDWRDSGWQREMLQGFLDRQTAVLIQP
jgi:hypothetical protein